MPYDMGEGVRQSILVSVGSWVIFFAFFFINYLEETSPLLDNMYHGPELRPRVEWELVHHFN